MTSIRIGFADDQPLFRSGIRMIIDSQPDLEVIWEASDGEEAVRFSRTNPVDIVIMDLEMPVLDGVAATARILELPQAAETRIVVLTSFQLNDRTFRAILAGASGFLPKNVDPEFLLAALRTVASGTAVIAPSATTELVRHFARPGPSGARIAAESLLTLTNREREVFGLVARGLSNNEIASDLHLSDATVKTHVGRVLSKLQLRDRVQLVIFAYERGLVRLGL